MGGLGLPSSVGRALMVGGAQCAQRGAFVPFAEVVAGPGGPAAQQTLAATPNAAAHATYSALLSVYAAAEATLVNG